MIVIEVPIAYFVMRPKPEDMGMKPYGADDENEPAGEKKKASKPTVQLDVTLGELKKQPFFYVYLLGIFAMCICGYGSLGQLSASLTDSYGSTIEKEYKNDAYGKDIPRMDV